MSLSVYVRLSADGGEQRAEVGREKRKKRKEQRREAERVLGVPDVAREVRRVVAAEPSAAMQVVAPSPHQPQVDAERQTKLNADKKKKKKEKGGGGGGGA